MERLTFEGNFCDIAQCRELPCKYDGNCSQKQVWERLKAYEDAGLSPQACTEAREIEETLSGYDYSISRMVVLMKADKDGRVVVLPCKVGDMLYEITTRKTISEYCATAICVTLGGIFIEWEIRKGFAGRSASGITPSAIGKTVFLTREEAEKALQKIQGKEDSDGATDKPE